MQPYYYKKHNRYLQEYGNKTIIIYHNNLPIWNDCNISYYIKFICGRQGLDFMNDIIKLCKNYNIIYETLPYNDSCGIYLNMIEYYKFLSLAYKEGYVVILMYLCEYKKIHNMSMIVEPKNNKLLMICDDENTIYI